VAFSIQARGIRMEQDESIEENGSNAGRSYDG
jgi:hypothetical protein